MAPPGSVDAVQGTDGGKLYDMRLTGGVAEFSPFDSVRDFHSFLRDGIHVSPEQIPEVNELVEKHENTRFTTCFIHGDDIVGIVDWDTAGWYPQYWEYTIAYNVNPCNAFWKPEVGKFLAEDPDAANKQTWSSFGRNTLEHFDLKIITRAVILSIELRESLKIGNCDRWIGIEV